MNAMSISRETVRVAANGPNDAWIVVVTKLKQERVARAHLRARGFEVYVPMRMVVTTTGPVKGATPAPLFPRFVFVRATLDAYRWQDIFATHGVQRVLCDPANPKGVKGAVIERLRREEVEGLIAAGLRDPSRPAPPTEAKARAKWFKLLNAGDVVEELLAEAVDERRKSLLTSLLDAHHAAIVQSLRKL